MPTATADPPNPCKVFRETVLQRTRSQSAALYGLSYHQVFAVETGLTPPPRRMLAVLDSLGYDSPALKASYYDWLAARSARLAAEIRAARTQTATA